MTLAVRFVSPAGDIRIGALDGTTIRDAGPSGPRGFVPDEAAWAALDAAPGEQHALGDVELLPPVVPGKVICIGLNYRDHAEENDLEPPEVPVVFTKHPTCLVGHGAPIRLPAEETRPDFEGEVAFVFSRTFRRAAPGDARATVGAYTAFNDVSGRRAQLETPLRQFTFGKSFDSFGPIGPALARTAGVDVASLAIRTTVSGELMQDSNTRNLIFSLEELVAYISLATTIEAGDVLATGTPGGVGDSRRPPRYLRAGDVVEIDVQGIPTLRNAVELERA
jgi:2,4-diketo-3-deoxy-L-fuconate hydrolase